MILDAVGNADPNLLDQLIENEEIIVNILMLVNLSKVCF